MRFIFDGSKLRPRTLFLVSLALSFTESVIGSEIRERAVLVVANGADRDSVRLARHYVRLRSLPEEHIIHLNTSNKEQISWPEFITEVFNPLRAKLVEGKWIDAIASSLLDEHGRRRYAISGHSLRYLVVCRGIPLKIAHDRDRPADRHPAPHADSFGTNAASVDSELSLLAVDNYPLRGWVANPLFGKKVPNRFVEDLVIRVARIDGPTLQGAQALVSRAIEAQRVGLLGRAYIDYSGRNPMGEQWLSRIETRVRELGFSVSTHRERHTFPATARFDAPALYFGWYAANAQGPFAQSTQEFPPGAIAVHIHSFSAKTLRSSSRGWCGPLVARGVTATLGNVFEPYLQFTHHLDQFFEALSDGMTLADAAYFALPVLSWQTVLIGDPLYRPFPPGSDADFDPERALGYYGQYEVIRRLNRLKNRGQPDQALAEGKRRFKVNPGLALALELAYLHEELGDGDAAVNELLFADKLTTYSSDDWLVAKEIAEFLKAHGQKRVALKIYQNLIAVSEIPEAIKSFLLTSGAASAKQAGALDLWMQWSRGSKLNH